MNTLTGKRYDVYIKDTDAITITVWADDGMEDIISYIFHITHRLMGGLK